MKPKKSNKLSLNKRTISVLNGESLIQVKGGVVSRVTCETCDASCEVSGCGTCDTCPTRASKCICVTDPYFCA